MEVQWGYAGVYPGEFGIWQGDVLMNRLRFVADHGFKSTGVSLKELQEPGRREQVGALVAERNLQLSVHVNLPYFAPDMDLVKREADAFVEELASWVDVLRTPIVTTCVGPYHRFMASPALPEQMDRLAEVLAPVATACHEMGRPLGIENHGDYYCRDLVELCERTPHLGIFLDTGNTYLIGEQSIPACREAAPYTIGTHFKDHVVYPDPKTLTFCIKGSALGDGHVGLRQVCNDLMANAPHPEKLVMQWELIPAADMDPFECLERSWDFVHSLAEQG